MHLHNFYYCIRSRNLPFICINITGLLYQHSSLDRPALCYKVVIKYGKLASTYKTRESITSAKRDSSNLQQITNSTLNKDKSNNISPLFNKL